MQSSVVKSLLSFVGIPLALFGPLFGAYMTFWMHSLGPVTPKRLEASFWGVSDPLEDLQTQDAKITVAATTNGVSIDNLRVGQALITNNGLSPIVPADEFTPLGVLSKPPWKIVNVVSSDKGVKLNWNRKDDYNFVSDPTLLNPGDRVFVTLYFSKPGPYTKQADDDRPDVTWQARIANLREISNAPDPAKVINAGWIIVFHNGLQVVFLLMLFVIYLSISLYFLRWSGLYYRDGIAPYASLLAVATINLCAAEAGTTYLFGMFPFGSSADNLVNVPPIALNALVWVGLFVAARNKHP
ncbi:hypothetical protein FJW07_31295 [Mesorhizobium sp. B3-1-9]|nr:hypothetical protein FJW07_31295 [Mesorhizobium sp. B3-1-9]